MNIDLDSDELVELAAWMEDHVAVRVAPGVPPGDVEYGVLDPDRVRSLSPDALDALGTGNRLRLTSVVSAWRRWRDREDTPDGPVYETTLGTSPWRERRRETPPSVPLGRDDLVWMEWNEAMTGQYHRATPGADDIPVVGGAGSAVLTTTARAESLGAYACPDCFPDDAGPYVSVTDRDTGIRTVVNTEEIDSVPDDALSEFDERAQEFRDAMDEGD